MQFLGTGAAEMVPEPLCNCRICREAREKKYTRLRSMFLLDEHNLIDCGPDFGAAVNKYGIDLTNLENVFITHTHSDHFCPDNAVFLNMSLARDKKPINVFMSEPAFEHINKIIELAGNELSCRESMKAYNNGLLSLHKVTVGQPFMVGGYEITAVNTTHRVSEKETCINYLFKNGEVSFLYATDTGMYIPESLDILTNSKVDFLVMEGTWGNRTDKSKEQHLNGYTFLEQLEAFKEKNIITERTQIFCTHINAKHDWNHDAYQLFFDLNANFNVTVASDGLCI